MIRTALASWLLFASMTFALNNFAWAQDFDLGESEFLSKCATCHGADGRGGGPLGVKLKTKPPNLTILAKRNKGVFSQRAVFEAVDGRKATGSHRIAEMPIWGCRHEAPPSRVAQKSPRNRVGRGAQKKRLSEEQKQQKQQNRPVAILDLACDPEPVIRRRIQAVVDYLRRIQEK